MKYIDYKEHRTQGTFNFPIAFYHENPHSPRYYMPYHWHTHYEIIRILTGTFQLTINDNAAVYQAGDVIFVTDGFLHGGTPHDCTYECVVFDLQILLKDNHVCTKTIHDIMHHRILIDTLISAHSPAVRATVRDLCQALASRQTGYEFMTQGYLYQLLGVILSEHLYEEAAEGAVAAERLDALKRVLTYISENYSGSITLDLLARLAGMNPKYFCRYFRSMTERTPIDYLNYYRIECACELLSTQNISVKEAAISCGFNDESYFIKTFHKYKGITPRQYVTAEF